MTESTIYLDYKATTGSVRFTLGRHTTREEVEKAAASLARAWRSSGPR
jgi:cysteine sulfinate desulfinase/cysteine desulfurase-like protein